ncbi:hypothetical protein TUM20985_17310 [Mycobacterium antarcticum]|uniref:hypothetical protein n=1 Tax=unclassified Mycolicibacterium TaxID=2636767 RepID=UPI00238E373D|nr:MULTISPECIES: hypothetical protein [unclassified Mycolicibacterium]BDX31184.1 hypothetical protein TUM20985_17310 [Mycolicibacterium sp. TUM20985]GLP74536.1 hypothetical protein TUM20983_16460 [Mycolicibacterium sp. TUM20983]
MLTAGTAPSVAPPTVENDDVEAPRIVVVYNCSRLGLTANPPGFSFLDFFRFGRRRR